MRVSSISVTSSAPHIWRMSSMAAISFISSRLRAIGLLYILGGERLKGTSNNCHRSSGAPSLPANDSALFSFRFCAVHPKDVRDCQLWQFFEVPLPWYCRLRRENRGLQLRDTL